MKDLGRQLDLILDQRPDLIDRAIDDFIAEGPESSRVVRRWSEDNNAKLSALRSRQLVGV